MILLSCLCALISALAIAVAGLWQRYGAPAGGLDQDKALYTQFVADVDRRVATGDLDAGVAEEERAEAARALLRARDEDPRILREIKPKVAVFALAITVALAYGAYMVFGHPSMPDQPYAARLKSWTVAARTNPDDVPPQAMAAVLKTRQAVFANQPAFWAESGRIDMLAGQYYDAVQAFQKAETLSPSTFTAWSELGEAETFFANRGNSAGTPAADAQAAFARALALDPTDARAHFYMGRLYAAQGRYDEARDAFAATLNQLAADDSRRVVVVNQLKQVDQAQLAQKAMSARIGAMVATLEAQLKAAPDNPDGWARLLRSYTVMGNQAAHDSALASMRAAYHDRPAVAASIESRANAAVGAENEGLQ